MARFHINPNTGEPSPCRAKTACPFGDIKNDHFDSKEAARTTYERQMESSTLPTVKRVKRDRGVRFTAVGMTLVATFSLAGCNAESIRSQDAPQPRPHVVQDDSYTPAPPSSSSEEHYDELYEEMKDRVREDGRDAVDAAKDEFLDGFAETRDKGREVVDEILREDGESSDSGYSEPSVPAEGQSADVIATLNTLEVKGRAPMTNYDRDKFMTGSEWESARQGVLQRDFTNIVYRDDGKVFSGDLADPYTGSMIHYEVGGSSEVDVDHIVSLGNAWASGAQYHDEDTRLAIATDPSNLLAVDSGANRQKGDSNAASWLPANKAYRCEYLSSQVAVKAKFDLWVTQSEYDAIVDGLNKWC